MRNPEIYLDNSATTRPCEAAVEAMLRCMREDYFNPSALYARAVDVERALKTARETVAGAVGAREQDVVFTSGGTESDNLAILGHLLTRREKGTVLYSAAEHPGVRNACREAAALYGFTAREIPLNARGALDLAALEGMLDGNVQLLCVMQVCNETGALLPVKEVAALRDRLSPNAALHVDGVQGFLRVPFSLRDSGAQSYAVSAHKVHGPKGVGALIVQSGHRLHPLTVGGGQQQNLRSGTENTVGILGFAAAVRHYPADAAERLAALKQTAKDALAAGIPEMRVLGPAPGEADAAPHILYAAFPPVRAETMVHALAASGIMVGTGSACSSHKRGRSEVLTAMGVPAALTDSSIRLSFSVDNTAEDVRAAAEEMIRQYRLLARFTRR
ncbi:MAG: cysteine desulfurase [Clostridiales bacterium]|nr:cysteine desulfurase [Clostridiales bacterium]